MIKRNKLFLAINIVIFILINLFPVTIFAWGDNYVDPETGEKGRPSYTMEEVEQGVLGNNVVFNSISDSTIGNEKDFVGTRACVLLEDGSWEGVTEDTVWSANDITVEDGKYYIIRLYVHNNNPNGEDAVAEDTHVSFSIPDTSSTQVQVNGFIDSSNATPSSYWDYVNFNSYTTQEDATEEENEKAKEEAIPFHLEYVYGSALLENNKIGLGGLTLSDDIVKAKSGGTPIGYDALDGKIPGGPKYANYVTVKVRAVFDYEYTVSEKVRLADSTDRTWKDSVDAKVGDEVEFRIEYNNTSNKSQSVVAVKDILPANLKYVAGSTVLKNYNHPSGARVIEDSIVTNGIRIGSYDSGANAYIYFLAEVVNEDLDQGLNTLVNWAQVGVGDVTIQDSVEIRVRNDTKYHIILTIHIVVIIICFIIFIITVCKFVRRHKAVRHK